MRAPLHTFRASAINTEITIGMQRIASTVLAQTQVQVAVASCIERKGESFHAAKNNF